MPLQLVPVRCLQDNYAWLLHGHGRTALIDAPEAAPILAELQARGWGLDMIALTHHHADHVQAVAELTSGTGARVVGNIQDAARLPRLDLALQPGDSFDLCGERADVIAADGHTIGHVAYHLPTSAMLFTGDSLMALGCGRLFEGDAQTMWDTLARLAALPGHTQLGSGHDYCRGNGAFALSVDPDNPALQGRLQAISRGERPCAPSTIAEERATNPFLRVAELRDRLGLAGRPEVEVFAALRAMKDRF
ncbi:MULTISPECIES: hydroxyacylglutathione hydrolase [unclassified Paracoccus (in: a-proteobacteria)]|uniref:hydroxyacylglutathione hydrolase n=1 Tax=unclassified Paracoccus (in: a-proteobacteria) TaxID=2688777 RepID=UPI0012B385F7|nr:MULTISPECIES: hydroxyacylglutathione hydrolase [unclassified Paracoccus (in: a-proteobacteria)]UXU74806.1 hydroxyacylglutathione hydrolase [Paracoccus sp. SMMA_5]UXU80703.1 hydroxyacylglutathione hydrolase [Paracoccus sp. SMMA_5_TC]